MKNIIIILLVLNCLISGVTLNDNLYAMQGTVIDIETDNDIIIIETTNGHMWSFEGIEDWCINDNCIVIFDTKGTTDIIDDEIVRTIYIA